MTYVYTGGIFYFSEAQKNKAQAFQWYTFQDMIKFESHLCPFCLVPEDLIDFALIREEAWHGRSDARIDVQ